MAVAKLKDKNKLYQINFINSIKSEVNEDFQFSYLNL